MKRLKLHWGIGLLLLVLVSSLVLGCANSGVTETVTTTVTGGGGAANTTAVPTKTPTAADPITVNLTFSSVDAQPEVWYQSRIYAQMVEQRTGGRVKVRVTGPGIVHSLVDAYEAVRTGVSDVSADIVPSYTPGVMNLVDMPMIPGIAQTPAGSAYAWMMTYRAGYFDQDLKDVHFTTIRVPAFYGFSTTKKEITTLADFRGLKLRTGGGPATFFVEALGATPVNMGWTDIYESAQKGVIDGGNLGYVGAPAKHYEVFRYHLEYPASTVIAVGMWNKEDWESLPPDLQRIIDQVGDDISFGKAVQYDFQDRSGKQIYADNGVKITQPSGQLKADLDRIAAETAEKVVSEWEKKGVPKAREAYNFFKAQLEIIEGLKRPGGI